MQEDLITFDIEWLLYKRGVANGKRTWAKI